MQIVPIGDNLHETPNPVFWENISLLSAELAQGVVKVKTNYKAKYISFSNQSQLKCKNLCECKLNAPAVSTKC